MIDVPQQHIKTGRNTITMQYRALPFLLFLPLLAPAQPEKAIIFSGRLVSDADQRGVPNIVVRVLGAGEGLTNDDGVFRIALPSRTAEVRLEVPESWAIVYPAGGRAPVPRTPAQVVEFVVRPQRQAEDVLRDEISRLKRTRRLKDAQIDALQATLTDSLRFFRAREAGQQAKMEALSRRLVALTDSLEKVYLNRNRSEVYSAVTGELLAFLDRTKDLRDQLRKVRDAFLHPSAMEQFNATANRYNEARNKLYDNHEGRLNEVGLLWENDQLTQQLRRTCDLALKEIHQNIVLPLNESVSEPMRQVATGRSSRLAVQPKATRNAAEAADRLAQALERLEEEIRRLTQLF